MIKFLGTHGKGAALLGLALSSSDLERLRDGGQLSFEVNDLGARLQVAGADVVENGSVVVFVADEAELETRLRAMDLYLPPSVLPKPPRFRALSGKGAPRRRTSAATARGARKSRTG